MRIKLDWRAYFDRFVEVHGEPVEFDNYLLFHDGWRYGKLRYNGPELSPPEDERKLKALKRVYWTVLMSKLTKEAEELRQQVRGLEDWNNCTSLPLQQRVMISTEDEYGKMYRKWGEPTELNLTAMKIKLEELDRYIGECMVQLGSINKLNLQGTEEEVR